MSVARIVTATEQNLGPLCAELRRAGYDVEFVAPGEKSDRPADLIITAETMDAEQALAAAEELASQVGADIIVAPGLVAATPAAAPPAIPAKPEIPAEEPAGSEPVRGLDSGVVAQTVHEFGSALQDGREGIRESLSDYRGRIGGAFMELRQRRELVAEARRVERERRELEKEERRRQQELLQRQRLEAEARERAERERIRREEEVERERQRREREAERQAALDAERARLAAETERLRAERERIAREREIAAAAMAQPPAARPAPQSTPAAELSLTSRVPPRPRPYSYAARRPAGRQKRLQRATLAASIVALVLMLGLAAALNLRQESPVPNSVVQNPAQQEVPFGPARINPKPLPHPAVTPRVQKPSPVQQPRHSAAPHRRASRESDLVADDEVVIHQYRPAPRHQTAQSRASDGVKRISDQ